MEEGARVSTWKKDVFGIEFSKLQAAGFSQQRLFKTLIVSNLGFEGQVVEGGDWG